MNFENKLLEMGVGLYDIAKINDWISKSIASNLPRDVVEEMFINRAKEASDAELKEEIKGKMFEYLASCVLTDILTYQKR